MNERAIKTGAVNRLISNGLCRTLRRNCELYYSAQTDRRAHPYSGFVVTDMMHTFDPVSFQRVRPAAGPTRSNGPAPARQRAAMRRRSEPTGDVPSGDPRGVVAALSARDRCRGTAGIGDADVERCGHRARPRCCARYAAAPGQLSRDALRLRSTCSSLLRSITRVLIRRSTSDRQERMRVAAACGV